MESKGQEWNGEVGQIAVVELAFFSLSTVPHTHEVTYKNSAFRENAILRSLKH
jgi:hypothetical protein